MPSTSNLRCGSGFSTDHRTSRAVGEAIEAAVRHLGGTPDLAIFACSSHHKSAAEDALRVLQEETGAPHMIGCVADHGVLTNASLDPSDPLCAVLLATLPGDARIEPFHLTARTRGNATITHNWPDGLWEPGDATVVMLADPYSIPADRVVHRLGEVRPDVRVVGGLTGHDRAGSSTLFLDYGLADEGAVGVLLRGMSVEVRTVLGSVPIGPELVVTGADHNVLLELGGRSASESLAAILGALRPRELALAQRGVIAGIVVDENRADHDATNYALRGVLSVDNDTGGLVIGDTPRVGQTIRFHVQDNRVAESELARLIEDIGESGDAAGGLIFRCFKFKDTPLTRAPSWMPVVGLNCQGEIGTAGRTQSIVHGFTTTMAVLRASTPRGAADEAVLAASVAVARSR